MKLWGRLLVARARTLAVIAGTSAACLLGASAANGYIYWTDYGTGLTGGTTIQRANLDGNGLENPLLTTPPRPQALVSDGTYIYWANGTSIGRANIDGSQPNPNFISGATTSPDVVLGLAVAGSSIYWTDDDRYVGRAFLAGNGLEPHFVDLGPDTPLGLAVSGAVLYIGKQAGIVVASATVGGSPSSFATLGSGEYPFALSVSNGYLYMAELNTAGSSSIGRVSTSGGAPDESYIPNVAQPSAVANDGTHVYWADRSSGAIGRAVDTAASAASVQPSFITDSPAIWGLAVDAQTDPTTTSVSCTPATVSTGSPSVCTATVSDSASSEPPGGTVSFAGSASTFFPGGNTCTLGPKSGGGASTCTVGAESASTGQQSVNGSYQGDGTHSPSSGSGQYCVGDATMCGGGGGGSGGGGGGSGGGGSGGGSGGSHPACKVPKLKGKTLVQARRLLRAGHCALGRVTKPRTRKGRHSALVISRQSPRAGSTMPGGTKVALKLVVKPRSRRR